MAGSRLLCSISDAISVTGMDLASFVRTLELGSSFGHLDGLTVTSGGWRDMDMSTGLDYCPRSTFEGS